MPTEFTGREILQIVYDFEAQGIQSKAIDLARALVIHAYGEFPYDLIRERRPHEPDEVLAYRCKIYKPITKKYIGKVITELNKIRRSKDWALLYENDSIPSYLENDPLEKYLTTGLPVFDSLTNWLFSVGLKTYLLDANAFVIVVPNDLDNIVETEFIKPVPEIILSSQVRAYLPGEYLIYHLGETCIYNETLENGERVERAGTVYWALTDKSLLRFEQVANDRMAEKYRYDHNLGYLPATQTGGLVREYIHGRFIYESRIADMVPDLDEAVREYSDLQAEVVNHIYSERWEYQTEDCTACGGSGESEVRFAGVCDPCKKCNGTGQVHRSPYQKIVIKAKMTGEAKGAPIPPAGYIQKDIEIVKIQQARIYEHIDDALSAINMQFIETVPLNQSGRAKEVDRDALNTFVHSIAEDIVKMADTVARMINDMRYGRVTSDKETRDKMLPTIIVPESFDMLSADYLIGEIAKAQTNKVSPILINALQKEYAAKKFNASPNVRRTLELTLSLDPLSGITEEDKLTRLSAKGITLESYVISSNISEFIERAIDQYSTGFYEMDTPQQKEVMNAYAREVIAQTQRTAIAPQV